MPFGDFAGGFADVFIKQIQDERERNRKSEDETVEYHKSLIDSLIKNPNMKPEHLGLAMQALVDLQGGKGKKKQAKGIDGFMGRSEEQPLPAFLRGVYDGSMPILDDIPGINPASGAPMGSETLQTPVQVPSSNMPTGSAVNDGMVGAAQTLQKTPPSPSTGNDALDVINGRMSGIVSEEDGISIGNAIQREKAGLPAPPKRSGLLYSPDQMAEMEGKAEGVKYKARQKGVKDADVEVMRSLGATDEQIREAMLRKMMGTSSKGSTFQPYVYMRPDGTRFSVNLDKSTGQTYDAAMRPFQVPPDAVQVSVGSPFQFNFNTDDLGNVSGAAYNRYAPTTPAQTLPVPPDVKGRTSPEGPVVIAAGPGGEPTANRLPRRGTGASTVTVPDPANPSGPQVPAVQPLPATEQQALSSNLTALQSLNRMKKLFKPEYVGPFAGRTNPLQATFGDTPFLGDVIGKAPEGFSEFESVVAQFTNSMIKAITGAQMSEPEATRIKMQLPKVTDSPTVYAARWQQSMNNIGDIVRAYQARGRAIPPELADVAASMGLSTSGIGAGLPQPPGAMPQAAAGAPPPTRRGPDGSTIYFTGRTNPQTGNPIYSRTPPQ